ncbi:sensor histidine kinase [Fibrella sp. WM1]|uniref:sensor histidine kinase n=1 Tax=Fibrella musci TaxID=3242485 RepID=UPI0035222C68
MTLRPADFWLRFIGIGLQSGLSIITSEAFWQPPSYQHLVLVVYVLARTTALWQVNRAIITRFRYGVSWGNRVSKRLAMTFLACFGATTLLLWVFDLIWFVGIEHESTGSILDSKHIYLNFGSVRIAMNTFTVELFHAFFYSTFYLTIYELFFFRQDSSRYRLELARSEKEREKLHTANLESQFNVLKQQVNPHFLFNALNSLSALISEDPQQAEVFVDKLSGVYRYVLRANNEPLTTLAAELDFIDSYFHLLQTRYGTGLSLTMQVDERRRGYKLPPLTLQLLVENAVKHNVVSPKRPLTILIYTDESGQLVVQNNLQRKATRVLSNGVGLNNIMAKYQILNLPQPAIEETAGQFTIRLSLLADAASPATGPAGLISD